MSLFVRNLHGYYISFLISYRHTSSDLLVRSEQSLSWPTRASVSDFSLLIILGLRSFKFVHVLVYFPHVRFLDHSPICILDPFFTPLLSLFLNGSPSAIDTYLQPFFMIFIVSPFMNSLLELCLDTITIKPKGHHDQS